MVDIAIHRCSLRIVRHGGWAWGPEPQRLLQVAINALPELLARELSSLWPDDAEAEFSAPISLSVPLSMKELLALTNESAALDQRLSPSMQTLAERIGRSAQKVFVGEQRAAVTGSEVEDWRSADPEIQSASVDDNGSRVIELLLAWCRAGVLSERLAAFAVTSLEAWLDQLVHSASSVSRESGGRVETIERATGDSRPRPVDSKMTAEMIGEMTTEMTAETIARLVGERVAAPLPNSADDRAAVLRRRLIVLTEVMVQLGLRQPSTALLAALDRAHPLPRRAASPQSSDLDDLSDLNRAIAGCAEPNALLPEARERKELERAQRFAGVDRIRARGQFEPSASDATFDAHGCHLRIL